MRRGRFPLAAHLLLLALFAAAMVFVWMTPVWLAGYPNDIPTLLLPARNYLEAGVFSITDDLGRFLSPELLRTSGEVTAGDGRLSMILNAWIGSFVPFTDLVGWSLVTSIILALCLIPWWIAVRSFFDARVAWISTVIFALMPIYWREAVYANNYQFALLFLFCSFAAYGLLRKKNHLLAIAVSGLFFGLSVSAKDAFLVFVPWFIICAFAFAWPKWKKATLTIAVFGVCSLVPYLAPYIGDIRTLGYPVNQNLARVWPGGDEIANEIYLHLYPDPYTYFFDRERFEQELLTRVDSLSALERLQYQKILLNFNVGQLSFVDQLLNGAWLFIGSVPSYFHQDVMGGLILWLFILPGIVVLWRKNRHFAIALVGLLIATELGIRFVLHFNREHLMDTGWALALLAGIGIAAVVDVLSKEWKKVSPTLIAVVCVMVIAGQLIQANRTRFARIYANVVVPQTVAMAASIEKLSDDVVVATPLPPSRTEQVALLSAQSIVLFAQPTVERLMNEGELREAFDRYGVTHTMGYESALARRIGYPVIAMPSQEAVSPEVTPWLRWLLHLLR